MDQQLKPKNLADRLRELAAADAANQDRGRRIWEHQGIPACEHAAKQGWYDCKVWVAQVKGEPPPGAYIEYAAQAAREDGLVVKVDVFSGDWLIRVSWHPDVSH